ncbi:hypothetical protein BC937DRAFT_90861 [Endogone sp. FLAS-F59071]|nr:hypothetical protein BC937DRAFT_90861 [Endogone sp. FLAS-F59071]|eukprot:RUS16736.1 hypothetical protein BC937DRAFT_90861 [Endogone sp. FLAS-F59071]
MQLSLPCPDFLRYVQDVCSSLRPGRLPKVKKMVSQKDFGRTLRRYKIPLNFHPKHPTSNKPVLTLISNSHPPTSAVRLLHATSATHRAALTHAFYHLYWIQNADITDHTLILSTARHLNIPYPFFLTEDVFTDPTHLDALRDATTEAVSRGAPGVPTFWIPHDDDPNDGSIYWGQDRLHFVEATLLALRLVGNPTAWDSVPRMIELYPHRLGQVAYAYLLLRLCESVELPCVDAAREGAEGGRERAQT